QLPTDNILAMLRSGKVPVLTFQSQSQELEVLDGEKERYVAISHVWADGLGNPIENTIPQCQARRLSRHLWTYKDGELDSGSLTSSGVQGAPVEPDRNETIAFWLDTLCIPVSSEHADLRNESIGKMGKIYQRAEAALVLDKDLEQIP